MQPSLMAILWKRGIRQSLDGGKVWVGPASRLTDDDRWDTARRRAVNHRPRGDW